MQVFFSLLFLIHFTVASYLEIIRPQAQEDDLAHSLGIFTSGHVTAEIPGNQLTISEETTGSTEPGIEQRQQQQQQWLNSPEAPLLAGSADAHCNNGAESFLEKTFAPSRFRRSLAHHAKRQGTTFCTPKPQKLHDEEEIPIEPEKKGPEVGQADSGYPGISLPIVQNIIMRTRMWGSISQGRHEGGCGQVEVPICVPFLPQRKYPPRQQSYSHFVVPVRFWEPEDPCLLIIEDLWCCDTAKQPDYSHAEGMPRYPGIGFACSLVIEQLQN